VLASHMRPGNLEDLRDKAGASLAELIDVGRHSRGLHRAQPRWRARDAQARAVAGWQRAASDARLRALVAHDTARRATEGSEILACADRPSYANHLPRLSWLRMPASGGQANWRAHGGDVDVRWVCRSDGDLHRADRKRP